MLGRLLNFFEGIVQLRSSPETLNAEQAIA
jgi:hypothetical protein